MKPYKCTPSLLSLLLLFACSDKPENYASSSQEATADSVQTHSSPTVADSAQIRSTEATKLFSGKYTVGDIHIEVKPVKMAYEIAWENADETTTFLFQEHTPDNRSIFVSEVIHDDARDRFILDEGAEKGVFIRSDGKEFPVQRIQQ